MRKYLSFASRNVDYIFSALTKKNWLINTELFTSKENYKLKRLLSFYPDALASGIGAVSFDWGREGLMHFFI